MIDFGAKGMLMAMYYMCNMTDQSSWDTEKKGGLYLPRKLWDRKGADPIECKKW